MKTDSTLRMPVTMRVFWEWAASDGEAVVRAVREVLDSYKCDLDDVSGEQVLIQRQITNISYSGVIFSREIKKDRPYYTITYDDSSTDAVTSGRGGKTVYIIRNVDCDELPANWAALIRSMRELEEMHPEYPLDVEFAIDEDNTVTIFQMRPLAASINGVHSDVDDEEVFRTVLEAEDTYREISRPGWGQEHHIVGYGILESCGDHR